MIDTKTAAISAALPNAFADPPTDPARLPVISHVGTTVQFAPFVLELTLPLPIRNTATIEDVELRLFAAPGPPLAASVAGLRVYLNAEDITDEIVAALQAALVAAGAKARTEYGQALDAWVRVEQAGGGAFPGAPPTPAQDAAGAAALKLKPFTQTMTALGDATVAAFGWGGNLHVINFLYRDVNIAPISLQAVLDAHALHGGKKIDLKDATPKVITVSWGPSPRFTAAWQMPKIPPRGSLSLIATLRYRNVLSDLMLTLLDAVTDLDGKLNDVQSSLGTITANLHDCSELTGDVNGVNAVNASLNAIKAKLGIP